MKINYAQQIPEVWSDIAGVFAALGDEQRQRIMLSFERGERLNVTQLVSASTLSRTAVSHHLKLLRAAGVLASRKEGKEVFFWIDKDFLHRSLSAVLTYLEDEV